MGINTFYISTGNGQGTCQMCMKPILRKEPQLVAGGYQTSGRVHLKCVVKQAKELLPKTAKQLNRLNI